MDEDWEMPLGSDFVPLKAGASTEDSISLMEESGEHVGVCCSNGGDAVDVNANSGDAMVKGKVRRGRGNPSWKVDGGGVRLIVMDLYLIRMEWV